MTVGCRPAASAPMGAARPRRGRGGEAAICAGRPAVRAGRPRRTAGPCAGGPGRRTRPRRPWSPRRVDGDDLVGAGGVRARGQRLAGTPARQPQAAERRRPRGQVAAGQRPVLAGGLEDLVVRASRMVASPMSFLTTCCPSRRRRRACPSPFTLFAATPAGRRSAAGAAPCSPRTSPARSPASGSSAASPGRMGGLGGGETGSGDGERCGCRGPAVLVVHEHPPRYAEQPGVVRRPAVGWLLRKELQRRRSG